MSRSKRLLILAILLLSGLACRQTDALRTENNTSGDWLLLFDGRSLDQWQSSTTDENVAICWQIRNGELCGIPRSQRPEGARASTNGSSVLPTWRRSWTWRLP